MCSGNRSFPLGLAFQPTIDTYNSVRDTYSVNFMWASNPTAPVLTNTSQKTITESGASVSSAVYNGLSYKLLQGQIARPTHTGWLQSPLQQQKNTRDFILTFKAVQPTAPLTYIFVVIPLLQEDNYTGDAAYFQGLGGQSVPGPFSLGQTLPVSDKTFAAYQTCFNPSSISALTLVFLAGRQINTNTVTQIGTATTFFAPSNLSLDTPTTLSSAQFMTSVRVATLGASTASTGDKSNPTSAYQCMVLDPERDVKDGKITLDALTGDVKHMNDVLADRKALMKQYITKKGIPPGVLEKYLAIFLGIILSILVLGGFAYLALYGTGSLNLWFNLPTYIRALPLNLIIALLFMLIGVLIGLFAK